MFIKTIRYILYLILLSSLIISFPNQPKAAFDIGHLIQVVYRPDDAEVGIDLDELRNLNLSQKNHTIKGPGTTFDINRHFTSSHSWDNINMGIFSLEMDSNQEWFAYFITTKPTAPQPSGSSFYAFKSAFDAIMGYYREIDKSDGEREGLLVINPTHHSSYFVKMNSTTTPGQYAGLNFKCCLDGEANLEDFKTKTFIDLYLYKIHDLGRGKVELIQGDSTPYVAVLRVFSDGTTILNPYENDAVNLTLDLDGNGGVELSPPNKIYFQDTEISFDKGIDISLTAKPSAGWKFAGWGGSLMGLENPVLLNLDSYKTVTATFTEISPVQFNLDLTITGQGFIDIDPPGGIYNEGENITLTAMADPGWQFAGWGGMMTGSENPATIAMVSDKNVTATFIRITPVQFSLNLTANGSGIVTIDPPGGIYNEGENITLTAMADPGWQFLVWEGDLTGSINPAIITMDSRKNINAVFYISSNADRCIGDFDHDGDVDGKDLLKFYNCIEGFQCPADLNEDGEVSGADLALFVEYFGRDDCPGDHPTLQYTLKVDHVGSGSVEIDPNRVLYNEGDEVTLTAKPTEGWEFTKWIGDEIDANNPIHITINKSKIITALFCQLSQYTLAVNTHGDGSVNINRTGYNQAELIAIPAEGWEFDSWSGDMEGTDNPAHLIIDSHKTITAIFKQSPLYTLTVNTQGEGSVRINKTGYNQAELIAIPAEGWEFDSWSGDMEGNSNPEILVIDIDKTVVAIFKMVAYHLTAIVDGGNGTITPEEATCSYSTIIWLTATPDKGYRILSWSGTDYDSSKENINRVTIYSDRLVMVKFIQISDMDRDFLSDTEEHGPSGDNPNYDGNGDGIPDYLQDNVVSMHNYNGMHYITLASSDLSRISDMEAVDPNSIPENIPDGVSLELGLFSFIITSLNADGSTNVKFYLDPNLTRGFTPNIYYKFGPTPDNTSDHWYPFSFDGRTGSIITGNTISLFFIDGERGDDDMTVNGIISDIGGPAFITISQQEEFLEEEDRYGCFITCLKYKPKRGL